jgi:hypothetical protein
MRRNHGRRKITPSHFTANSGDLTADTGFARDNWIGVLPQTIQLTMSSNVPCGERCFGGERTTKGKCVDSLSWRAFSAPRASFLLRVRLAERCPRFHGADLSSYRHISIV